MKYTEKKKRTFFQPNGKVTASAVSLCVYKGESTKRIAYRNKAHSARREKE